ncbi:hypothetical protein, partial [Nocardiopsis changdeensis]|uniref:hypothetical protein n=1 Tax=Nocardiopsis changdeensis TaxID=2831969 RepID=UPI003F47A6A1
MFSLLVAARTLLAVVLAASVLGKLRGRSARRDFVSAVERLAPARAVRALTPPDGGRRRRAEENKPEPPPPEGESWGGGG